MSDGEKSPADQLVELLVYAPVGMIYEYDDVLEQLVKRGKSQLQLARLVGKMAAQRGQREVEENVGEIVGSVALTLAKGITQFGESIGLAPQPAKSEQSEQSEKAEQPPPPVAELPASKPNKATGQKAGTKKAAAKKASKAKSAPLPIAGYDDLKAKEIVELLGDLSPSQRARVRSYELKNRARKTVVGKIDRLDA